MKTSNFITLRYGFFFGSVTRTMALQGFDFDVWRSAETAYAFEQNKKQTKKATLRWTNPNRVDSFWELIHRDPHTNSEWPENQAEEDVENNNNRELDTENANENEQTHRRIGSEKNEERERENSI